jgi:hypothetical protein
VPDVDASEGSGAFGLAVVGWRCLGCIPDVDGVDDECGELDEDSNHQNWCLEVLQELVAVLVVPLEVSEHYPVQEGVPR